jgi:hypothetical protein
MVPTVRLRHRYVTSALGIREHFDRLIFVAQSVHFREIQLSVHVIENEHGRTMFNPVASAIPKWQMFRILRWMQYFPSHRGTMTFCNLMDPEFTEAIFKPKFQDSGRLKFIFCFMNRCSEMNDVWHQKI